MRERVRGGYLDGSGGWAAHASDHGRWLHLAPESAAEEERLGQELGLPADAAALLFGRYRRPRIEELGDGRVFGALPLGDRATGPDSLNFLIAGDLLLTCAHEPRPSIEEELSRLSAGSGSRSLPVLLGALPRLGLNATFLKRLELDDELARLEAIVDREGEVGAAELRRLRARAGDLRALLSASRAITAHLAEKDAPAVASARRSLRDSVHTMSEELDRAEQLIRRSSILRDELEQRTRARTDRAVYVITLLSGVFLPLSFVTGLLGVNVGGVPARDDERAFVWLTIALVASGLGLWRGIRQRRLL